MEEELFEEFLAEFEDEDAARMLARRFVEQREEQEHIENWLCSDEEDGAV